MTIWKTEYLKYKYFFGTIFCIELLLDIFRALNMIPMIQGIDTIYSFWQMLSWIAIVALVVYNFFAFFYLGKDRLLHLLTADKYRILQMKAIVFGTYMMSYFFVGLIRYLILLPETATNSKIQVALLYFGSKSVAVISFLVLLIAVLVIIKNISNKVIGALFFAVILGVIIAMHAYILFQFVSRVQNVDWFIGIVDGAIGMNQYANILPIVFLPIGNEKSFVEDSFYTISLVLNGCEIIVGILIARILFIVRKFNYVEM